MLASPEPRIRNTAQMMDPPGERPSGHRVQRDADDGPLGLRPARGRARRQRRHDHLLLLRHPPGQRAPVRARHARHDRGRRDDRHPRQGLGHRRPCARTPTSSARSSTRPATSSSPTTASTRGRTPTQRPSTATRTNSGRISSSPTARSPRSPPPTASVAIRNHMCGATDGAGDLRRPRQRLLGRSRWPPTSSAPRSWPTLRPDGFNLDNSPYLDRLVHLLRDQQAGRATVEETLFQVTVLSPTERAEAAGATLITTLARAACPRPRPPGSAAR